MPEAFSKTFRGAPYSKPKFQMAAMDQAVEDILKARGISFVRGTVEASRTIGSISRLAARSGTTPAEAQPRQPIVTTEMMVAMTIEIAQASRRIFGDIKVLQPDSLRNISVGLASSLRNDGGYCVNWTNELPLNWQNELARFEQKRATSRS